MIRALLAGAAALATLALPALAQTPNSHNSGYFPGGTGLAAANGDLVTLGTGLTLSGGTLTAAGGTGGSAVRAAQLEMGVAGNPLTTVPYYLTTYAELPGTIAGAKVAALSASGANLQFVVHIVHPAQGGAAATDTPVTGLNGVGVCNGENLPCNVATYATPYAAVATGANTYVVGDQVYVSYNTVGGTFTSFNFHLSLVQ